MINTNNSVVFNNYDQALLMVETVDCLIVNASEISIEKLYEKSKTIKAVLLRTRVEDIKTCLQWKILWYGCQFCCSCCECYIAHWVYLRD